MIDKKLPSEYGSWLTINRACNLMCKWCYARSIKNRAKMKMSMSVVKKSINILRELPVKRVVLIGGEPTIHPDFIRIVRLIKQSGLCPVVITNGIAFAKHSFLQEALDAGISGVTVSLKGFSEDEYYNSTGKREFSNVMSAIENISRSGVDHNVSITLGSEFTGDFSNIFSFLRKKGAKHFSVEMEEPTIINGQASYFGESSPSFLADLFVRIYPELEKSEIDYVMKIYIPFCLFPVGFIEMLKLKNRIVSGCHMHNGSGIIIDPIGRILPCNHFCDNPLGEIYTDFSTGKEYLNFRKRKDVSDFYDMLSSYPHENCQNCPHWTECGAGCRINWLCYEKDQLVAQLNTKGGE